MKKVALLIMLLAILSKIFGLGRDIALSFFFGTSYISDAYLISITIPSVLFGFITTALLAGFIPMYTQIELTGGKKEADYFTNNLINVLILLCTIIILIVLPFTSQITKVFASGFSGEALDLTIKFTKISLLTVYFSSIVTVYSGYMQVKGNYTIPALIGLPLNIITIISIFFSSKINLIFLSIGLVVSALSQVMLMAPYMRKLDFRFRITIKINDKHLINMGYVALPVILGVFASQINVLVDRTLASRVAVGGISALNYANTLNQFVQGIFVWSISTALYPIISKMAADNNLVGLKNILSESIIGISLFVVPITVGSMMFSTNLVSFLYGHGAFDDQAIFMTSQSLLFYSVGMVGFGLRDILTKVFYSLQDTRTPMINAFIAMVLNIILTILLSRYLGIGGIALATSITVLFTTLLLFIRLRKKVGSYGLKQIIVSFVKILVASLVMGLLAKFSFSGFLVVAGENLSLIISIIIGAIFYFVIIYFMKIKDVDMVVDAVKKKFEIPVPIIGNRKR